MLTPCAYEIEVRALVAHGQWPAGASSELRAHVATCRACGDLALVADAFQRARTATIAAARPGPAGVLWWRAQLRRRNVAVERLTRPILGAQIFALAFTLVVGVGFLVFEALRSDAWRTWLQQLPQSAVAHWDEFRATGAIDPSWGLLVVFPTIATLLLLGAVAVYMATDRQ
ncbi:hypothetical protein SBA5_170043 [Candidatus Sulfotelmatomonas gaucii]|uniref:Zinc-finger domain-containing protein n=1 Tax=Candidatus Sulfuritelmatomonas gaucii TaxID=2043161 RepID=A0A2N9L6P8_9BACT|nr:hypothetical protein SBA5_170043 [Candidatus Sulfotelmatomonas gaucii]